MRRRCHSQEAASRAARIRKALVALIPAAVLAVSQLAACVPAYPGRTASLRVGYSMEAGYSALLKRSVRPAPGRSLYPADPWTSVQYQIVGSGPGGATFSAQTTSDSVEARVVPGEWTILITGMSASGKPVLQGSGSIVLEAGRESALSLILSPVAGNGTLSMALSANYPVPPGARIKGSLEREGFASETQEFPSRQIDIPADQASLAFSDLPAGFYTISLTLADPLGAFGGFSETVLVLADFETAGSCQFEIGTPLVKFGFVTKPARVLQGLTMQIPVVVPRNRAFTMAAALDRPGMAGKWRINGADAGGSCSAQTSVPPRSLLALSLPLDPAPLPLSSRMDFLAGPDSDGARGSASGRIELADGPSGSRWGWRSSFGAKALTAPSLFRNDDPDDAGTGVSGPARAVAASGNGLVAVSGLDGDGALHLFLAAPGGSGFVRLWRDKLVVGSTVRNADRLAFSPDGRVLAAAASSGSWLRLLFLTESGDLSETRDFTYSLPGLSQFDSIRALRFSPDGARLHALANSPEAVYTFGMGADASSVSLIGRFDLDGLHPGLSMGMNDLAVAADGTVVASASTAGILFQLHPAPEGLAFSGSLDRASGQWSSPEKLAVSDDGLSLFALCDGAVLRLLRRTASGGQFEAPLETMAIPAQVQPVRVMASGGISGGVQALGMAGGPGFVVVGMPLGGPGTSSIDIVQPIAGDAAAVGNVADLALADGVFFAAGGTKAVVSTFGAD